MSKTIANKTMGNVFIEKLGEPMDDARIFVENAPSANVYAGASNGTAARVTFSGAQKAALKQVAAYLSSGTSVSVGSLNMTLDSISTKTVYGGALSTDIQGRLLTTNVPGMEAIVNGDVELNLTNGRFTTVYGGGAGYGSTVTGDVTINYGSGRVVNSNDRVGTIYGGGANGAVVEGDVHINIDARAAGKIGSIYAGGNNAVVKGNTVVTFSNGSGLYKFSGTVSGGGKGGNARVDGSSTLVFNNYSGDFRATIKDFDHVKISGGSSVTLVRGQDRTMKGATYEFVITDETRGRTGAMLTLNKKAELNSVTVTVDSASFLKNGGEVILIASKYFRTATSINTGSFTVQNSMGDAIYAGAYKLVYNFDRKLGGAVTFVLTGTNMIIDKGGEGDITLTDGDEETSVKAGAKVTGDINMLGGDDTLSIQTGAEVYGNIKMGEGDDYLVIQKDALVTGYIDMGKGNDRISVQENALVSSEIFLREGVNLISVEKGGELSGTIVLDRNSTNTIEVNGGAISGIRSTGDETTVNTIILSGVSGLGGGVGTWINGEFFAQELVLKGNSTDTVVLNKNAQVTGINFGKGEDTLVLNRQYNGSVVFEDGNDMIVAGTDLTLDGQKLLLRGTGNILVVMNGRTVEAANMTIGDFHGSSGSGFFDGIYLSQNAGLIHNGTQYIQNYIGSLDAGDLVILADSGIAPERILEYYSKQTNGVTDAVIKAASLDILSGATVDGSELEISGNMTVRSDASISDSGIDVSGKLTLESGAKATGGDIATGDLVMKTGSTVTGTLQIDGNAEIAGEVGADLLGTESANTVTVKKGATFTTNKIDLGSGNDAVVFTFDFSNAELVLLNVETVAAGDGLAVVIGSAAGSVFELGLNTMVTETVTKTVSVADWNKAISFADGYTVNLYGVIDAKATLNNNTVNLRSEDTGYFAQTVELVGSNTIRLAAGVATWGDWQQFSGATDKLVFQLETGAFLAIDGFVSETDRDAIKTNTSFADNSTLALGEWAVIQNWNKQFSIDDLPDFSGGHPDILTWNNLEVREGGKIWGGVFLNNLDNAVVINSGAVLNGSTGKYDFAAIDTKDGDDTLTIGAATVNGRIVMGAGDNELIIDGATVNRAINQTSEIIEIGNSASENEIDIRKATLNGDVRFHGATKGEITDSAVTNDLLFGDGFDEVLLKNVRIGDDLNFGGDSDTAVLDGAAVNGDVILNGGKFSFINGTTVGGDVDFGGSLTELTTGDAEVAGDLLFGDGTNTLRVQGEFSANGISWNANTENNNIFVEKNGALTLGAGNVDLMASENNQIDIGGGSFRMEGNLFLGGKGNDIILHDGGSLTGPKMLVMIAENNRLEVTESDLTAEMVFMNGATNHVAGAGTIVLTGDTGSEKKYAGTLVMNGADNSVEITGGTFTADTTLFTGEHNVFSNTGTVVLNGADFDSDDEWYTDLGMVMTGNHSVNTVTNGETGVFTAANIMLGGENSENTITNDGTFTAGNVTLGAGEASALCNALINNGDMTVSSLALIGQTNTLKLDLSASLTVDSGITMTSTENLFDAFFGYKASYDTYVKSNMVTTPPINVKLNADMTMTGEDNEIYLGFQAIADGALKDPNTGYPVYPEVDLPAVAQVSDVNIVMKGDTNMTGTSNYVELAYFQIADQGGDIKVNGDAVITTGDIAMRGSFNNVFAWIYLAALNEGVIDMGNHNITMTLGNISMDTDPVDGINPGTDKENSISIGYEAWSSGYEGWPNSKGEIRNNDGNVTFSAGDIVMLGTGVENTLEIGNKATAGSITMGNLKGASYTASNTLSLGAGGSIDGATIKLIAASNTITLLGSGVLTEWMEIAGGENSVTIGSGFRVEDVISFGGIYAQNHTGSEGGPLLKNTKNYVSVHGYVGGIDTSVSRGSSEINSSDDIIKVENGEKVENGGKVGGDILTGPGNDSVILDFGTVTGSVMMGVPSIVTGDVSEIPEYENTDLFLANFSTVEGDVKIFCNSNYSTIVASQIGGDLIAVASSVNAIALVVGLDGEHEEGSKVAGNVTMNANTSNSLSIVTSEIGGDVTMNSRTTNSLTMNSYELQSGIDPISGLPIKVPYRSKIGGNVNMIAKGMGNHLEISDSEITGNVFMSSESGSNIGKVQHSVTGTIETVARDNNELTISGRVVFPKTPGQETTTAVRSIVNGDVRMSVLGRNDLNFGLYDYDTDYNPHSSPETFGCVTITGAVVLKSQVYNNINVWAGSEVSYSGGPSDGKKADLRALVGSIEMTSRDNSLTLNEGTLGVTTGGISLKNTADDGVIADSSNIITVANPGILVLEEANGERKAVSLGSANVHVGSTTESGEYGDIGLVHVERDANGYETYYYEWKDTSTTTPDTAVATHYNNIDVSGKFFAGDLSLTGQINSVYISGPAEQEVNVGDMMLLGKTNSITVTHRYNYVGGKLVAKSITMGDIEVPVGNNGTVVKIQAESNSLWTADDCVISIGDIRQTATNSNSISLGNFVLAPSKDASDVVTGDGNKLVRNAGDYSTSNPYLKELPVASRNRLGNITMNTTDSGTNGLSLGKNAVASDLTMTGGTNKVTLWAGVYEDFFVVNANGEAVRNNGVQKKETYITQMAAEVGDITFRLPGTVSVVPTNTLEMGEGSKAGSITSTDTWMINSETHGAVDTITLDKRATVTGDVALGYGDDVVTMKDQSKIAGKLDLGAGKNKLTGSGDVTISLVAAENLNIHGGTLIYTGINISGNMTVDGSIAFAGNSSTITVDGTLTLDLSTLTASGTLMTFSGTNNWDRLTDGNFAMEMNNNILANGEYLNLASGFAVDLSGWAMDDTTKVLSDVSLKIGSFGTITNFVYDDVNNWALATNGGDTWKLSVEGDSLRLTHFIA